jgi:hypothetical protein
VRVVALFTLGCLLRDEFGAANDDYRARTSRLIRGLY